VSAGHDESRRRTLKRLGKWLGIVSLACVLLVGLLLGALHTPQGRRFVLSRVTALLASRQIDFRADQLRYNLLDLSLDLRDVTVRSARSDADPPFAVIARVRADLSLQGLLRGRYVLQSGTIEGARVHYLVDDRGDNLPRAPRDPNAPEEPLDYLVESLDASAALVRYENRVQHLDATIPVSSLRIRGDALTDRHTVTMASADVRILASGRDVRLDALEAEVVAGEDDLEISKASVDAAGSRVEVSGAIRDFAAPTVDGRVRASIDVERAAGVARIEEPLRGRLALNATVKGPIRTPLIEGRVEGRELAARTLEGLAVDASLAYDAARRHVAASNLQVRAPWGSLDGNGAVSFERGPSHVRLSVRALDAGTLMRAAGLEQRIASRLEGDADLRWPALDYAAMEGAGTLSLRPTQARASRNVMPVAGRVALRGDGGRVSISLDGVRAAGASVNGSVTVTERERLAGAVRLHVVNVGDTARAAEAFLGRAADAFMSRRIAGPVDAVARLGGTIARATAEASVEAPSLEVKQAGTLSLAAQARYSPDVVTLHAADLTWGDARAHAEGRIGLAGRPLDLRFSADRLAVPSLLALAAQDPSRADGVVSADGSATGTLSSPQVDAHVEARQLAAAGETLGRLDVELALAGRRVTVSQLVLDKPQDGGNGRLTASGSYALDSRAYSYDVRSADLRLVEATLPDGRPLRGEVSIAGSGSGTVDAPAGELHVAMDSVKVAEHDLGAIRVDASAASRVATIDVLANRFGLTSKTVVRLTPTYPATVEARLDNLELAALPMTLQTPLEGRVTATARASLELAEPSSARVDATIQSFAGAWNQQPFALTEPAVLGLADERVTIDRLRLALQDSTISVSGTLPMNGRRGEGEITLDARANLDTLAQYAPAGNPVTAAGVLELTGRLRGNLEVIDPDLQLTLSNASFTTPALGDGVSGLNARARVADGVATLEQLTANWSAAAITATATLPLELLPPLPVSIPRRGGPAQFGASLAGLDLARVPGAPSGLTGVVSVDAAGSAARPDLAALTGSLTFPELRVAFRDLTLEQQGTSTVRIAGGRAEVERFTLAGSAGTLGARGTVGLLETRPVDIRVEGDFNTAIAASFTDALRTEGRARLNVAATGTLASPRLDGFAALENVTAALDEPAIVAEQLNARVDLTGDRLTLSALSATVNGGTLTGSGGLAYRNGALEDVNVELATRDFAFDAPLDLRSLSDATIVVTETADDELLVSGRVVIREGGLTGDINFDTGLLATLDQPRSLDLTEERNPLLQRVAFNVQVQTTSPIVVDNNVARAEVRTNLRLLGSPYEPGLTGTLTVAEGGEITLNERRYEVERGTITFLEERRIVPSFDLRMNTSAGNYDVTLAVTGEPGDTESTLTSNPTLPEPDIMALLVTGRTLDQMRGEEGDIAKEQVLSYLAGRVGSQLGREIEQATGLSDVRLEPNLIANETDPSARLTVGQELTDDLRLIYSTDLADSNDQVWVARYDVTRRFQTNAVRQPEGNYRLDFRHDVRFGGRPSPRRLPRTRPAISTLDVVADGAITESEVRDRFGLEAGDTFDYFAARDGVERIEGALEQRGRLQSRVRLERRDETSTVGLTVRVEPGPLVQLNYKGVQPPSRVDEEVRQQWNRGVFDAQRVGDAMEVLREWLIADRYFQPTITHELVELPADGRQVTFVVTPGARSERIEMEFAGASAIDPATLDAIVDEQDLELTLFTDPVVVTELLEKYYREEGYLSAQVDEPRYTYDGPVARAVLNVREGPRFTIRNVTVRGNKVIPTQTLLGELPVRVGDPFLPRAAANALDRTRELYWRRAYNDMHAEHELTLDRAVGLVDVTFDVVEGRQSVVADVRVAGHRKTSDRLVAEQLEIKPGEPLDLARLGRSRRNLYDTGAFSLVDITRDTVTGSTEGSSAAESGPTEAVQATGSAAPALETQGIDPSVKPVVVNVQLREVQPVQLTYGASYDTEHGFGGIVDVSNHNTLGKARVLGLSGRYDASLREGRVYFTQPSLRYWPVATTASVYYTEERNAESELADPFNIDRFGLSVQQERTLGNAYVWTYGYRWERARKFAAEPGAIGETTTVAPLTSTFTREARDEVLDASRGSFTSHGFSYSPTWLGAETSYVKYFGQYFHYFPLERARRKRFTNEILRPRFVFATGVRLGLARGFGDRVPETERFYAGGSTTLRGFEQNAVGPVGPDRIPTGGEGLLVFNNEVRYPLFRLVDGVGFLDVGNVFDRLTDFDITDLRETAGIGLRVRTPWFLVRGDYGFVLDQRPGERRSRFYFSIGQAF
jgi:outer membrane protein assembly factor BamA/autotransporter translocation and assembly factor TamB